MNNPNISLQLANDTITERIRQAESSLLARRALRERQDVGVVLRAAHPCDADGLARLAELDSAEVPAGELLLAFVNGRLLAAVGAGGGAIADPFAPTAHLVELMRRHVRRRGRTERRPFRRLLTAGAAGRVGRLAG